MNLEDVSQFLIKNLPPSVGIETAKILRSENVNGVAFNCLNLVDLESLIPTVGVRFMLLRFQQKPPAFDLNSRFEIGGKDLTNAVAVS